MIESYLEPGSQKIGEHIYGKSITDPCLGWEGPSGCFTTLQKRSRNGRAPSSPASDCAMGRAALLSQVPEPLSAAISYELIDADDLGKSRRSLSHASHGPLGPGMVLPEEENSPAAMPRRFQWMMIVSVLPSRDR